MMNNKIVKFLYIAYVKLKAIGQVGMLCNFRSHWANRLGVKNSDFFNEELKQLFIKHGKKNDTTNVKKRRHRKIIQEGKELTMLK